MFHSLSNINKLANSAKITYLTKQYVKQYSSKKQTLIKFLESQT